jgi:hypothetical protein
MAGVDLRTAQELMRHKTMAMTLRYLSPGHQIDAVRRRTATGSGHWSGKRTAARGAEVVDLPREESGGGLDRTADLGIMRPSL